MSATIAVEGLAIDCVIGLLPAEREGPQRIFIDADIDRSIAEAARLDDVNHTVDYVAIADSLTELAVEGRFELLETLAVRGVDLLIERFGADRARIKVMKPGAIAAARHASVTFERTAS